MSHDELTDTTDFVVSCSYNIFLKNELFRMQIQKAVVWYKHPLHCGTSKQKLSFATSLYVAVKTSATKLIREQLLMSEGIASGKAHV